MNLRQTAEQRAQQTERGFMFKRVYGFLFAGNRKVFLGAPLTLLFFAGSALAPWIIFSGVTGSGQGNFGAATTNTAITIAGQSQPVLSPGDSKMMSVNLTNNDPNNAHQVTSLTATFSATPSQCAQYLSEGPDTVVGTNVNNASTTPATVTINLANTAPVACASGSWTVSFTGATS